VVAVLVGEHVRLRELARRAELVGEHPVEAEVDVDAVVGGAVERADAGVGGTAGGADRVGEEDRPGRLVRITEVARVRLHPVVLDRVHEQGVAAFELVQSVRLGALLLQRGVVAGLRRAGVAADLVDAEVPADHREQQRDDHPGDPAAADRQATDAASAASG
jgi:hypothetical protein